MLALAASERQRARKSQSKREEVHGQCLNERHVTSEETKPCLSGPGAAGWNPKAQHVGLRLQPLPGCASKLRYRDFQAGVRSTPSDTNGQIKEVLCADCGIPRTHTRHQLKRSIFTTAVKDCQ